MIVPVHQECMGKPLEQLGDDNRPNPAPVCCLCQRPMSGEPYRYQDRTGSWREVHGPCALDFSRNLVSANRPLALEYFGAALAAAQVPTGGRNVSG